LFFDNNLCRLIEEYIEPESNPKESIFGELVLTDYYTIKREGKKFYEQIVEAETGKNFPGFFAKLGKVVAWPADKLLGLEKIADMKKAVEAQKKAIEDKVKEIQDIKAQTETLTVALEETKKENEKLKAELEESKKEPEWEVYPSVLDVIEQDTAQAKPTISPTDSLSMDVKSDSLVVASTDSLGNITPPKNITPEDSLNLQNINTITADTLSSVSNISKIDFIKSNKNTVPVYLTKEDSLQASRIELQNEIKNSSGQASETGLKLPEDIEQLKARKEALKKERESLEIKLVQSDDAQESKQINEELIALDEELKQILEKMKIRLQEEKAILEKESNRLR
jgi:DNA repair exonuclease SbcCD ATPase subunit